MMQKAQCTCVGLKAGASGPPKKEVIHGKKVQSEPLLLFSFPLELNEWQDKCPFFILFVQSVTKQSSPKVFPSTVTMATFTCTPVLMGTARFPKLTSTKDHSPFFCE